MDGGGLECRQPLKLPDDFGKTKAANWLAFYKCNTNWSCGLMLICGWFDGYAVT